MSPVTEKWAFAARSDTSSCIRSERTRRDISLGSENERGGKEEKYSYGDVSDGVRSLAAISSMPQMDVIPYA